MLFLQETKQDGGASKVGQVLQLSSDHEGHWGVAIWIHAKAFANMQIDCLCKDDAHVVVAKPKILAVTIKKGKFAILLVAAHFPQQDRDLDERLAVHDELRALCRQFGHNHIVLAGIGANARLPPNYATTTGDLEFGDPDEAGEMVASLLHECDLQAPSTFRDIHETSSSTWRHPSGSLARIDYVVVGGAVRPCGQRTWTNFAFDLLQNADDHWAASLQAEWQVVLQNCMSAKTKPKYNRRKLLSPQGRDILNHELTKIVPPDWSMDVQHTHAQELQEALHGILQRHFPHEGRGPRAEFIDDAVWRARCQRVGFKRRTRRFRETFVVFVKEQAFVIWKALAPQLQMWRKARLLYELFAVAIGLSNEATKKAIRQAKQQMLKRTMKRMEHKSVQEIQAELRRMGIGGRARKKDFRILPNLKHATLGNTSGRDELDELWLQHFSSQEMGTIQDTEDFIQSACRYEAEDFGLQWDMAPSLLEVEESFRRQPVGKAAGLDGLPSEIMKASPTHLARLYQPLFAKSSLTICRPLQWRGGQLYDCYKGSGESGNVGNFRSLYISSTVGKSYHKLLRHKREGAVDRTFHPHIPR